uniref:OTU domain-containing protein n=1 Tax=Macrostomum lignano TaxID=282301 RepID=A0A1I8J4Z5_9PLAT
SKKPAAAIDCKTGEPVVAAPESEISTPAVAAAAAAAGEDKEVVKGNATVDCELRNAAAALQECGLCDDTRGVATLEDDTEYRGSLATLQVGRTPQWMPLSACWLKRIPGDGNCFFSALSDQLQGTALEMNADNLRQTLAVELENLIDSAENDTGISEAEWRDLLEKTKRKGEYVSDHVASAAARLLGIEICVPGHGRWFES